MKTKDTSDRHCITNANLLWEDVFDTFNLEVSGEAPEYPDFEWKQFSWNGIGHFTMTNIPAVQGAPTVTLKSMVTKEEADLFKEKYTGRPVWARCLIADCEDPEQQQEWQQ